ncbi:MAG: Ig-like domain-containing protein [Gemmatimonadetes bacterium]|nr:Ig-like domain-containing protein [Gemmatimonadota bacterium]
MTRVVISVSEVTLTSLGDTVTLTAQASDASGNTVSGKPFTWTSSNAQVATVRNTGLVTAVASGPAGYGWIT